MHYLDGYITVIKLPDWSRALYINSNNTRLPRCEKPLDVWSISTRDCSNAMRVFTDCSDLRNLRQTSASVPSNGTNAS